MKKYFYMAVAILVCVFVSMVIFIAVMYMIDAVALNQTSDPLWGIVAGVGLVAGISYPVISLIWNFTKRISHGSK